MEGKNIQVEGRGMWWLAGQREDIGLAHSTGKKAEAVVHFWEWRNENGG